MHEDLPVHHSVLDKLAAGLEVLKEVTGRHIWCQEALGEQRSLGSPDLRPIQGTVNYRKKVRYPSWVASENGQHIVHASKEKSWANFHHNTQHVCLEI